MKMIAKIAWKNITYKPINSGLCICLLLFGVSIITVLLSIQNQLEQKFERDLQNTDLVLGAKGSPLQLVLSAIYHLDAPTGNINYAEALKLMNDPLVEEAIPLAYGDSYLGYRILGTTEAYLKKYKAQFQNGEVFLKSMQVNLGANVAKSSNLKIGDNFNGSHGDIQGGHIHEEHIYEVVGVLEKTNTVLDNLVLTSIESVWQVHDNTHKGHSTENKNTSVEINSSIEHNHKDEHEHEEVNFDDVNHDANQEITAVLIKYKTKMSTLSMPSFINKQTNMQAVLPALEINRLFYMLGIGTATIKWIASAIILMASLSVFLILYSRLRERQYELALMRSLGYKPKDLFMLLLFEGLLLVSIGYIFGWLISRLGLYFINKQAENDFNLHFSAEWVNEELGLLLITLLIGIVSSLLPAWKAMQTDVSKQLLRN